MSINTSNVIAKSFDDFCVFASEQGASKAKGDKSLWNLCEEGFLSSFKGLFGKSAAYDIYVKHYLANKNKGEVQSAHEEASDPAPQVAKFALFLDLAKLDGATPSTVSDMRAQVERIIGDKVPGLEKVKSFEGSLTVLRTFRKAGKVPAAGLTDDEVIDLLTPAQKEKEEGKEWQKIAKAVEKIGKDFNTPVDELAAVTFAIQQRIANITLALAASKLADAKAEQQRMKDYTVAQRQ
jgi:hypothetical protein